MTLYDPHTLTEPLDGSSAAKHLLGSAYEVAARISDSLENREELAEKGARRWMQRENHAWAFTRCAAKTSL